MCVLFNHCRGGAVAVLMAERDCCVTHSDLFELESGSSRNSFQCRLLNLPSSFILPLVLKFFSSSELVLPLLLSSASSSPASFFMIGIWYVSSKVTSTWGWNEFCLNTTYLVGGVLLPFLRTSRDLLPLREGSSLPLVADKDGDWLDSPLHRSILRRLYGGPSNRPLFSQKKWCKFALSTSSENMGRFYSFF